jgi:hypothetical protein
VAYAVAHGPGAGVHLVDVGADDVTELGLTSGHFVDLLRELAAE